MMMVEWLNDARSPTYEFEYYTNRVRVFVKKMLPVAINGMRGERMSKIIE